MDTNIDPLSHIYEYLGWYAGEENEWVPRIIRLRVPAKYGAVVPRLFALMQGLVDRNRRDQGLWPPLRGDYRSYLEIGPYGFEARPIGPRGEEHSTSLQRGLKLDISDNGDETTVVAISCWEPLLYPIEFQDLIKGIRRFWPCTEGFDGEILPSWTIPQEWGMKEPTPWEDLPFTQERAERYVKDERERRRRARESVTRPQISRNWIGRGWMEGLIKEADPDVFETYKLIRGYEDSGFLNFSEVTQKRYMAEARRNYERQMQKRAG